MTKNVETESQKEMQSAWNVLRQSPRQPFEQEQVSDAIRMERAEAKDKGNDTTDCAGRMQSAWNVLI